jgi:(4-O-methyl)-D-glucuronate---lignin esterase
MTVDNKLPDLFTLNNGSRVETEQDWLKRRTEVSQLILDIEYGEIPPYSIPIKSYLLHPHNVKYLNNAKHIQYKLSFGEMNECSFILDLLIPEGEGPFPVILNGDNCWRYPDQVALEVLKHNFILATFNRTEIAPDNYSSVRDFGIYNLYPDSDFGAITAWAWGYQRAIDFLVTLDKVNTEKIAITGHSRGGKAVLLAGATDERIAITSSNNSGCGGAGCFKLTEPGCEKLADIIKAVPYWFSPKLQEFINREEDLPFDQHFLKAMIAPRVLLTTEGNNDIWANPLGTQQTHNAAQEVFNFLGVEKNINIHFRDDGHGYTVADWQYFLNFCLQFF